MMNICLNAHEQSFISLIYMQYHQSLCNYFLAYCHDKMLAEDLTHDLFARLMELDVITESTTKKLVYTIAKRMIIDIKRHEKYKKQYNHYIHCHACTANDDSTERIDRALIRDFNNAQIAKMPSKRAKAYRLYLYDELNAKEISKLLHKNTRTVEGYIYQSNKELKGHLMKYIHQL